MRKELRTIIFVLVLFLPLMNGCAEKQNIVQMINMGKDTYMGDSTWDLSCEYYEKDGEIKVNEESFSATVRFINKAKIERGEEIEIIFADGSTKKMSFDNFITIYIENWDKKFFSDHKIKGMKKNNKIKSDGSRYAVREHSKKNAIDKYDEIKQEQNITVLDKDKSISKQYYIGIFFTKEI